MTRRTNANRVLTASGSSEWFTPPHVIARVRHTFRGTIDLDPCSCDEAQAVVGASSWHSLDTRGEDSGAREVSWTPVRGRVSRVFVNPPYGHETSKWIARVVEPENRETILLVNNHTHRKWFSLLWDHAAVICFPWRPLRFLTLRSAITAGAKGYRDVPEYPELVEGMQPTHGSVLALFLPPTSPPGDSATARRFAEAFSDIGKIIRQDHL